MAGLPLSPLDYRRLHRVLASVADAHGRTERGCVFFAIAGSYVIDTVLNKNSQPVAGAAIYKIDEQNAVTYAEIDNTGAIHSDLDHFHCWIECDGYAIDLMAPLFEESIRSAGHKWSVSRKMFQRPLTDMARPGIQGGLDNPGSFLLVPNPALTNHLLNRFTAKPAAGDLSEICASWFTRYPSKIKSSMQIADDLGKVRAIPLRESKIDGAW